MISLRVRPFNFSDWTDISIDGELEDDCENILVSWLSRSDFMEVQKWNGEEWEEYDAA